ncbi:MAG: hypothetical protein JWQ29_500, partial [Phenylobacterium sp.]|nr:hypothetical protein [Phenylobacterium sp.]
TRDRQGPVVWKDILAFIRDPAAPFPSNPPPIPRRAPREPAVPGRRGVVTAGPGA